jgi:hypothetical protein
MSGNPYEKSFSGKPLKIPAQAWNTLMDVAQKGNAGGMGGGGIGASAYRRNALVWVQNDSGADVGQFAVLGIDDAGITPTDNLDSFKNEVFLSGVTPTTADYTGWFVVTVAPIADGEMGLAFAAGVFPVKVNMVTSGDSWADVKNSDATQLQSSNIGGAAQILWSESGTGTKWAVVRLGNPSTGGGAGVHFSVLVKANGDDGTNPIYDLYALADTGLGTALNLSGPLVPECSRARFNPSLVAIAPSDGSVGEAYRDIGGAIHLYNLPETVCGSS